MGATLIENSEYKELILKENKLEESQKVIKEKEIENKKLKEKYAELEEELKELVLMIVDKNEHFYGEVQSYDIKENDLAKYLTKYYFEDGKILYRKQEIEIEESEKEC